MHDVSPRSLRSQCRVCGVAIDVNAQVRGQLCGKPECQRKAVVSDLHGKRAAHIDEVRKRARAHLTLVSPDLAPEDTRIAVLPSVDAPLLPPSEERRAKLRRHLEGLVQQLAQESTGPVPDESEESEAPSSRALMLCATCGGNCCQYGFERALIDLDTLRAYRQRSGASSWSEVVDAYMRRLPEMSVAASCHYHAATGCALTRDMRAAICNSYYCELHALASEELAEFEGATVLAVATKGVWPFVSLGEPRIVRQQVV